MLMSESLQMTELSGQHGMLTGWLRILHESSHNTGDTRGGGQEESLTETGCKHSETLNL